MSTAAQKTGEVKDVDAGRLHVVLGAGGGTGDAIVRELVGQGRRVRAVTRGGNAAARHGALPPASFEDAAADVTDREQLRRALEGAAVVYHCAQPAYTRWPQEFPAMTRGIMAATAAAGAKLVFADNLYMYGPVDGPMTEETPPVAQTKKGKVRAAMAEELMAADRDGSLRVVIGRSSDYFGPGPPQLRHRAALLQGAAGRQEDAMVRRPRPASHHELSARHGARLRGPRRPP